MPKNSSYSQIFDQIGTPKPSAPNSAEVKVEAPPPAPEDPKAPPLKSVEVKTEATQKPAPANPDTPPEPRRPGM